MFRGSSGDSPGKMLKVQAFLRVPLVLVCETRFFHRLIPLRSRPPKGGLKGLGLSKKKSPAASLESRTLIMDLRLEISLYYRFGGSKKQPRMQQEGPC